MSERRLPLWFNLAFRLGAVVALVLVANVLGFRHYARLDLSRASVPPLTERTKSMLRALPQEARLIVFFNATNSIFENVNLLALQYAAESRKITVEHVNPYRELDRATEVARLYQTGQRENAVIVVSGERARIVGLEDLADYDREPEAFGQPARVTAFKGEQAVTAALIDLMEPARTVYFLRGQGQPDIGPKSPIGIFAALLKREALTLKELPLAGAGRIPNDASLVVSVGAKYDPGDPEFQALRDYWGLGGRVLLLLDPDATTPKLQAWLGSLGIMVQDDRLYAHPPSGLVSTVAAEFVGKSSIAQRFREVNPFLAGGTQSLKLEPARVAPAKLKVEPLLQAVNGFWGEVDWRLSGVNGVDYDEAKDRTGDLVIAATVERGEPDAPEGGRALVVSNTKYLLDDALTQQCADFTVAGVNWLLKREALVGIPPREMKLFTLSIPESRLSAIFGLVVLGLPAVAGGLAIFGWWRRRS